MKKFVVLLVCLLVVGGAFAAGENIATSKAYVDNAVAQKQDTIPTNDGTAQVLTNTGVAGEIGTKNIYDPTGEYATQTDSLITAGDFNTAVQNAIDTEFECIAWRNPDDHNSDCMLVQIRGVTDSPSGKNLFNLQKSSPMQYSNGGVRAEKNLSGYVVTVPSTVSSGQYRYSLIEVGNIQDFMGKTLTVSANSECINGGHAYYMIGVADGTGVTRKYSTTTGQTITISGIYTDPSFTKVILWLYAVAGGNGGTNPTCTYTDIQVEEGSVATEYEPYQNLYLPSGN